MEFIFKAKSADGAVKEGIVDAVSTETAISMLQEKGLVPISIERKKEASGIVKDLQRIYNGVSLREQSVFFRQLATLIQAKVPVVSSLEAVGEQSENNYLRIIVKEMVHDIEDGTPLSEAMMKHPDVFKPLTYNIVRAGEVSGNLQRSLSFLADNAEKNYELNAKIKGAMFYPAFVLLATIVIAFVVLTFVLPKLTMVFEEMDYQVPWYTRALMNLGNFMQSYWYVVLLLILASVAGFFYYIRTEDGKKEWDVIKMKIPVFGRLFQYIYIARFSENLSVLLDGGIPIVRALIIAGEVVNSTAYESIILRAADEVKVGGDMSTILARNTEYIPPIVTQMTRIGEESGQISEVLRNVSDFYTQETERITRNLSTLIEPVLICILGAGVAIIVFAVLMPIYGMTEIM